MNDPVTAVYLRIAYQAGVQAASEGRGRECDPFVNRDRDLHQAWDDGWIAGSEATEAEVCGVLCAAGPNGEMLGCGFPRGHKGKHAWATLPTFVKVGGVPVDDAGLRRAEGALKNTLLAGAREGTTAVREHAGNIAAIVLNAYLKDTAFYGYEGRTMSGTQEYIEAVERATATAERYGDAIVAIQEALKDAPTEELAVIRVRVILAGLAGDDPKRER